MTTNARGGKGTPMRPVKPRGTSQTKSRGGGGRGVGIASMGAQGKGKQFRGQTGRTGTSTKLEVALDLASAALLPLGGVAGLAAGAARLGMAGRAARAASTAIGRGGAKLKSTPEQTPKPTKTPTLYHGSAYPFKKGDVVKPFRRKNGGASATPSYKMANSYAQGRGSLIPKGSQGEGKAPRVFEVKPVSTAVQNKKFNGREFNDAKGFKVVREAKVPKPVKPTMKTSPKPPLKGTSPKKRK